VLVESFLAGLDAAFADPTIEISAPHCSHLSFAIGWPIGRWLTVSQCGTLLSACDHKAVKPMAPRLDQRRRALALLVAATRIYGSRDADADAEAEYRAFLRKGKTIRDIPPGTVERISPDEVAAGMLGEDRCRAALDVLVSAYGIYGPPDAPDGRTWTNKETQAKFEAYLHAGGQIFDIPPEVFPEITVDEVIAATLAEDAAATEAPPKRGQGRPPTPHRHMWITCTIEAYIGAGVTRVAAIERAAEKWGLALSTIDKIYRENKFLKLKSEAVRDVSTAIRWMTSTTRLGSSARPRS
jgi:hypothetical protein